MATPQGKNECLSQKDVLQEKKESMIREKYVFFCIVLFHQFQQS